MSQETIRALEQVRQRLNQLATSLGSLRRDLENDEYLPSWPSIQNSANLLSHNLASLQTTLSAAQPQLTAAHAYPLPSFPGRTQEDLLGQLLRKKLQPPVEDWLDEGKTHWAPVSDRESLGTAQNGTSTNGTATHRALSGTQIENLWTWAGPEGNRIARDHVGEEAFNDVFTLAEQEAGIENVATGLRRKFWESDDEGDEDRKDDGATTDGQKMDIDPLVDGTSVPKAVERAGLDQSRPMMSLETVLRFMSSGILPAGVQ